MSTVRLKCPEHIHKPTQTPMTGCKNRWKKLTDIFVNRTQLNWIRGMRTQRHKGERQMGLLIKHVNFSPTNTQRTCLWRCFGRSISSSSFPVIILSLSLYPRSQQPLRNNTPTLPTSPATIFPSVSQLAARAWSKPADWCHKTAEKKRNKQVSEKKSVPLVMFLQMTKDKKKNKLASPLNPQRI